MKNKSSKMLIILLSIVVMFILWKGYSYLRGKWNEQKRSKLIDIIEQKSKQQEVIEQSDKENLSEVVSVKKEESKSLEKEETKIVTEKGDIITLLENMRPKTEEDVRYLVEMFRVAKNEEERKAVLLALLNIDENDTQLADIFLEYLDDSDRYIRVTAIRNLRKLKDSRAVPIIREMLSDYSAIKLRALEYTDQMGYAEMVGEISEVIFTLAEAKDEEGLSIIAEKGKSMGAAGSVFLSYYGKMALPKILEFAREEKTKEYGIEALAMIEDKEAEDDLLEIMKDEEKDFVIRIKAVYALTGEIKSEKIFNEIGEGLKKNPTDKFIELAIGVCYDNKSDKAVETLISILENTPNKTYDDFLTKQLVISYLGDIGNSLAVPILEKELNSSKRDIRELAAYSLKQITGKEYEWENLNEE